MNMKFSMLIPAAAALAMSASAKTIYVSPTGSGNGETSSTPCSMSTAWTNVAAGDTIQLLDGTYTETAARGDNAAFTVRNKNNVTFQGNVDHPESVVIDFGGSTIRGFYSPNNQFTIRGITFQNKKTSSSFGVIVAGGTLSGQALVENCRFINITTTITSGDGRMGTLFLPAATGDYVFRNCEIRDVDCYQWGAVYMNAANTSVTFENCTVSNCTSKISSGGGVFIGVNANGVKVKLDGCRFMDCQTLGDQGNCTGGVLYLGNGSNINTEITGCTFDGGFAYNGGQVFINNIGSVTTTVDRCTFRGCKALNAGAALFTKQSSGAMTVRNTLFTGCCITKQANGGTCLYTNGGMAVKVENCTFADNQSTATGNTPVKTSPLSPESSSGKNYVKNCVFWNNKDANGALVVTSSTGNTIFENCVADKAMSVEGMSQITVSPFAGGGDYSLSSSATDCIDSGAALAWMTGAKDLAGNDRVINGLPDLGAYEFGAVSALPGIMIIIE